MTDSPSEHPRRDGFARIPDWLTRHAVPALRLTAAEGMVYVAVRSRAGADGLAWPSYPLLAFETNTSENTAARAVKRLVQVGLLDVVEAGRQHRPTVYRVVESPRLPPKPERPMSKSDRRRLQTPHHGEADEPTSTPDSPPRGVQPPHHGVFSLPTTGSEVDTGSRHREVDTRLKPPSRGRRRADAPASPRQLAFIADLTSALGYAFPSVESHEHADGLIREYWREMERRRAEGEAFDGSIMDLSPAGQRYARRCGFIFTNPERRAS
jgi:hypothetical protein